jgi:hypothetical protein
MKELLSLSLTQDVVLNSGDVESMEFTDGIVLRCGNTDPQINLALPRQLKKPQGSVLCEISYTSTTAGILQIYWDYGRGLSEENSTKTNVISAAETKSILLPVVNWRSGAKLIAFRIDPPNGAEFVLKGIKFIKNRNTSFKMLKKIDNFFAIFDKIRVLAEMSFVDKIPNVQICNIESMEKSTEGIVLKCGETDPQIYLSLPQELEKSQIGGVICEIRYTSTIARKLQIFWNYGEGFSEENSSKSSVLATNKTKSIRPVIKNWRSGAKLVALRIDPPDGAEFVIEGIRILNAGIRQSFANFYKSVSNLFKKKSKQWYKKVSIEIIKINCEKQKKHYDLVCKNLANKVRDKQKIRVAFLVAYDSIFNAKFIFEKMLNDNIFDPFIIITADVSRGDENMLYQLNKSYKTYTNIYGSKKVILGYVKETQDFIDYSDQFDIFCFSQPYEVQAHIYFTLEYLKKKDVLIFHAEYGHKGIVHHSSRVMRMPVMSLFWKVFTESKYSFNEYRKNQIIKGGNVIVCGFHSFHLYKDRKRNFHQRKCVIIAPHHSCTEKYNKILRLSNFLVYADFFLELPRLYPDIDFVFRPHPLLVYRLEEELWGKKKTDAWFKNLLMNENVTYSEGGDFYELFINSDAIIHDCGAFTLEYLFTGCPCCYMLRQDTSKENEFTKFGIKLLKQYYWANEKNDIIHFIDNVVIKGIDPLKNKRKKFSKKYLYQDYNTADKIIEEMKRAIIHCN